MANVEDRVVEMGFENSKFEKGVSSTLGLLDKLKNALNFSGSKKGLDELESSAGKFNLGGMATAVDGVSKKFLGLSTVAITALATITTKAIDAGLRVGKAFTLDPIMAGFQNYETQIKAVQTILANTGLEGSKGLGQVNDALSQLNTYANQTVYNFSEMARNIGTFTAAGVDLKTSTASIKGIANLAALSGSTSDQASTAMYQLSQAIASNQVKLQDWNSVVNAGMGGKVFQEALFNTAKALHTIKNVPLNETFDQWTKAGNSFRGSLQDGWITGKVLTQTLEGFTGDLTAAQLKSMGYNAEQIKQIQKMGKTATDAATKIKTFSQLTDALKEEVATAYATIFKTIFGDINQATELFSAAHTVIENALTGPIYALNTLLEGWAKLGGRTKAIDAIKNSVKALSTVLKPIKDAFRQFFPPKTAEDLYYATTLIDDFSKKLIAGSGTIDKISRTFKGFFALFDIARTVVYGLIGVVDEFFKALGGSDKSILDLTAKIGDFIVKIDDAIQNGGALIPFFQALNKYADAAAAGLKKFRDYIENAFDKINPDVLKTINGYFTKFKDTISTLFDGFDPSSMKGLENSLGRVKDRFEEVVDIGKKLKDWASQMGQIFKPAAQAIENALSGIWDTIKQSFSPANFDKTLDVFNTAFLGAIALMIKKFLTGGVDLDIGGGTLSAVKESLEGLTGTLKAMQTQIKANIIEKIAVSVGILAAAMVVLSLIDSDKLTTALQAIAAGMVELLAAVATLSKISGAAGFTKIPLIAGSLDLLSVAILLLSVALKNISGLDWPQLEKGLAGLAGIIALLVAAVKPLSANSAGMITAGLGITALSVALNLMYFAVLNFSKLSWQQMEKGLAGVTGSLVAIAGATRLMPKNMAGIGLGLLEIALAVNALYLAVLDFSKLSWKQMEKGLAGIAGSLLAIAGAMQLMPKGMIVQAAALDLVAIALLGIGKAVSNMGGMSWKEIGKGMTVLAGSLAILAGALYLMDGALPGAAALVVAATGITLLGKALDQMGSMSWGEIGKGVAALAAALAVVAIAGIAMAPVVPTLLGLGAAVLLLGGGLALAGVGLGLLANGLANLAKTGSAGIAVIMTAFAEFIQEIPQLAASVAEGIVQALVIIGQNGPAIVQAFSAILGALLEAVTENIPKLETLIEKLVEGILDILVTETPKIIAAGISILESLLKGIADNIGEVTKEVGDIIVNFLNALSTQLPRIIAAGVNLLVKFLGGISDNLGKVVDAVGKVITSFITAVGNLYGKVITAGVDTLVKFLKGIGDNLDKVVTAVGDIIAKFITAAGDAGTDIADAGATAIINFVAGIINDAQRIVDAATGLVIAFITALADDAVKFANAGLDALVAFLNGIADAIRTHASDLRQAGLNIAGAIVDGMTFGLASKAKSVAGTAVGVAKGAVSSVGHFLGINSPSKKFIAIGEAMGEGTIVGLDNMSKPVADSSEKMGNTAVESMRSALSLVPGILSDEIDLNPTITPILDLSDVKKNASQVATIFDGSKINAAAAFSQAAAISSSTESAQDDTSTKKSSGDTNLTFNQTNNSPKALSPIDVYRKTKNQLSLAKEELKIA